MQLTRALLFGLVALAASIRSRVNPAAFADEVADHLWRRMRAERENRVMPAIPAVSESPSPAVRELVDCAMEHSLSSAGEDLFTLPTLLRLTGDAPGVFVELGAYDGIQGSNSYMLERCLNWTGLLIEANPRTFKLLQQSGRRAPIVHGAVCADKPGGHIAFQDTPGMDAKQSLETPSAGGPQPWHAWLLAPFARWAEEQKRLPEEQSGMIRVPCKSLTAHMADHGIRRAHVMMLDVERAEAEVMRNTDLTAYSMVVAEVLPSGLNGNANASVEAEMRSLAEAAGMRQSQAILLKWSRVYLQRSATELPMHGLVPPEFNQSTPRLLIDQ